MISVYLDILKQRVTLADSEIELTAIRAQGAGGQNVNKVSSAIHLRFNIAASSLPQEAKSILFSMNDSRRTAEGDIIIKAQTHRTQQRNRDDAVNRLKELIERACVVQKKRYATKPSYGSKQRRLESKTKKAQKKSLRKKIDY